MIAIGVVSAACLAFGAVGCSGGEDTAGPIVYQSPEGLAIANGDGSANHAALPDFVPDAFHADWSPDGGRIVFVADESDGTRDIWTAAADGSNVRKLVDCESPCRDAETPAWSPDGKTVAFIHLEVVDGIDQGATVRLITVATGEVTTVVATTPFAEAASPRWSPDGEHLVVELLRWASARGDEEKMTGSALGVVALSASAPTVRRITDFASFGSYPDWHPSEDLIVFQAGSRDPFTFRGPSSNLFTVRPDGTGLTALTSRGPERPWLALPTWTPDGDRILVTLVHALGEHTLATLDREGRDLEEIVDPDWETPVRGAHARQSKQEAS
jgi:Tol biopolymer transport system component